MVEAKGAPRNIKKKKKSPQLNLIKEKEYIFKIMMDLRGIYIYCLDQMA